jgi:7-cyano-7-deazaguanine reductase
MSNPVLVNPTSLDNFPEIETWPNAYPEREYTIHIELPEFTSVCPKTGLPDFATIHIDYIPGEVCVELKSLKYYLLAYRNFGLFYESVVNKIMDDIIKAASPRTITVTGEFTARGGLATSITAEWSNPNWGEEPREVDTALKL